MRTRTSGRFMSHVRLMEPTRGSSQALVLRALRTPNQSQSQSRSHQRRKKLRTSWHELWLDRLLLLYQNLCVKNHPTSNIVQVWFLFLVLPSCFHFVASSVIQGDCESECKFAWDHTMGLQTESGWSARDPRVTPLIPKKYVDWYFHALLRKQTLMITGHSL